jgi:integrase
MGHAKAGKGVSRGVERLSDAACRTAVTPASGIAKLSDGRGLYLAVLPSGTKSWRLKYRHGGKEKTYSIGPYPEVGLKAAREKRDEARAWLREGVDPTAQKHALRNGTTQAATFASTAADYLKAQIFTKHHFETLNRILNRDLNPELGKLPIAEITTPQVLAALRKIEDRGQLETCAKARRFASQVFRYAIATGTGTNDPAVTLARGVLKPPVVVNRATVPVKEFPALLKALAEVPAELNTKLACYWVLLTACRVGEMRFATWGEIEDGKQWAIPAARMKMKLDHLVPLATQAQDALKAAAAIRTSDDDNALLFPGFTAAGHLSENALIALIARCGFYGRQTAHGFRASFSTWAHEVAEAHPDIIEACLAHAAQGVRAKYNRSLYLKQRAALLQAWADQLTTWGMRLP